MKKMKRSFAFFLAILIPGILGTGRLEVVKNDFESDPEIKDVIDFAFRQLESGSNNFLARKILKVKDVKTQIVAGKVYVITLRLGTTQCLKNYPKNRTDDCPLAEGEGVEECVLRVWTKPWEDDFRRLSDQKCRRLLPRKNDTRKSLHKKKLLKGSKSVRQLRKLQSQSHFKKFMLKYEKDYDTEEEYKKRHAIFKENMKKVQFLRETERGTGIYGATQFADLTEDEFRRTKLGLSKKAADVHWPDAVIPNVALPRSFDWRKHGAVTPVKNQGACGSCWAFSVTGNIEALWFRKTKKLLSLSEQELVDCDKLDNGCGGGLPDNAYKAIMDLGGLETETEYTYDGEKEQCKFQKSKVRAEIDGAVDISQNETKMAQWLVTNGPISIGLNANAMQFYMGGVSHPFKFLCSPENIDHGVLIVGFGVHHYPLFKTDYPFWIIKNSWGQKWGEEGYYRLYRGDGTCGVNQMASSAILK